MYTNNMIITGTGSGLGKYLRKYFEAYGLVRNSSLDLINNESVVVHCAYNNKKLTNDKGLELYEDNVLLTERILKKSPAILVYMSSIEVYLDKEKNNHEDDDLKDSKYSDLYAEYKYLSECLIKNYSTKNIIFRMPLLLDHESRDNTVKKVIDSYDGKLSLNEKSNFYCISYDDVAKTINDLLENNIFGTFNLCPNKKITLNQIKKLAQTDPRFGDYVYESPNIDNQKIKSVVKYFDKTSEDTVLEFLR